MSDPHLGSRSRRWTVNRGPRTSSSEVTTFSGLLTDLVIWFFATAIAAIARFDFSAMRVHWTPVVVLALCMAGAHAVLSALLLRRSRYLIGSLDEIRAVAVSASVIAAAAMVVVLVAQPSGLPRSLPFLAWPLALIAMSGIRVVKRLIAQAGSMPADGERVLVFGAGWLGNALVQRMLRSSDSQYLPVGFLEDDLSKRNLRIHGVRVVGTFADLPRMAAQLDASAVVVAINSADAAMIRKVSDAADAAGLSCLVLPKLSDSLMAPQVSLSSVRTVDVQDLIGRRPVDTDVRSIASYVTGKRVMVTGAGGSIGSELCKQLHRFTPAALILVDRDESALHATELEIYGRALLDAPTTVLVDIRDDAALDAVFDQHRPQVVFHAAALKHLTLLERFPAEAVKSNVMGTLRVLDAAFRYGADHFVNISTDKAANPTSVLGRSKRLAEQLTSYYSNRREGTSYLSVRFGNVLGSRGSVVHTFYSQLEAGGPLTVTDPDVSRFFMTIPEACQLVIQAGAIGRPGEALVLDMGEPVKIVDVARRMVAMSGKDIDVVFTGLREGEKLREELLGDGESGERPLHPLISHVQVPPLSPPELVENNWVRDAVGPDELSRLQTWIGAERALDHGRFASRNGSGN